MQGHTKISIQEINDNNQMQPSKDYVSNTSMTIRQDRLRKSKQIAKKRIEVKSKKIHQKKILSKQNISSVKRFKKQKTPSSKKKVSNIKNRKESLQALNKRKYIDQQLLRLFNCQINQYIPGLMRKRKFNHREPTKNIDSSIQYTMKDRVNKFNSQSQIKVVALLQQRQKLIFSISSQQNMTHYEKAAQQFILNQKRKSIQLQNTYKQINSQKYLKLLLQKKQSKWPHSFILKAGQITQNSDVQVKQLQTSKITQTQKEYLKELTAFQNVWQQQVCSKINQTQEMKTIAKSLLVLSKCYLKNKQKTTQIMQKIALSQQKSQILQTDQKINKTSNNQDFYIKCLIKKCMIKALDQDQTIFTSDHQILNYFKLKHYEQQNLINQGFRDNEVYNQIQTQEDYKQYMKRMKNKKIIYKPLLHTNCSGCFSNHFQKSNPILKCPECKYRMHKFCGKFQQRCYKCTYKKMGTQIKSQTPKCFICLNESTSLMLHKIKGNKFAHNFCIMFHNLWNIINEQFTFELKKQQAENQQTTKSLGSIKTNQQLQTLKIMNQTPERLTSIIINQNSLKNHMNDKKQNASTGQRQDFMVNESQTLKNANFQNQQYLSFKQCKFCQKGNENQTDFLKQCSTCHGKVHILCAYLHGCKFDIYDWKNHFQINLRISCCAQDSIANFEFDKLKQKRMMSRRYKLNYDKFAFNYGFQDEIKAQNDAFNQKNQINDFFEQAKIDEVQTQKYPQYNTVSLMQEQKNQI